MYATKVNLRVDKSNKLEISSFHSGIVVIVHNTLLLYVGTKEKREFLKKKFPALTEDAFANSRDLSFEEHVMRQTKGSGVNLVLNSLAGEKLEASLRCLSMHGRFLEIGKYDLSQNTNLGMLQLGYVHSN